MYGDHDTIAAGMTFRDDEGVDHCFVNDQDREGRTPVRLCCEGNHSLCLSALLSAPSIDVNKADFHRNGYTPLIWAIKNSMLDCARLLIEAPGIDINYQIMVS
jgi:ankyrin repeat protein